MRRLIDLLGRAHESHHHIQINTAAMEDITWWQCGLVDFHGQCAFACDTPLLAFEFPCDACVIGGVLIWVLTGCILHGILTFLKSNWRI